MNTESTPQWPATRLRRLLSWIGCLAILCGLLIYGWFYLFQEVKLFEPHKIPTGYIARPDLTPALDDFVRAGEAEINFQKFVTATEPSNGTVFFLHGNRGNIELCRWAIEPFLHAGYDVWTMDYRGYGKSTGRLSEAALLADAQLVYKRIRQEEREEDIVVWGRSLGSGMAAYLAAGNSPKALVLETPYWSLPDAACHSRPYLFPFMFRYTLPTHAYLCDVDCPVYLIHGTADEKIYFESSEKLQQLGTDLGKTISLRVVPDGEHNLRSDPAFRTILEEILNQISAEG
jgi:alpha-beta hydrolase superfamily lysophospholipase